MSKVIKLKKGLDINLKGKAAQSVCETPASGLFSLKPSDFPTLVPHLEIQEGVKVKAGSVVFTDKNLPEICFCSPVSGTVKEVRRAERRRITDVVIEADNANEFEKFDVAGFESMQRDQIVKIMLASGVWPYLKQRPYNIIANPNDNPKAVYVSCFDSAPLACDYQFVLNNERENFNAGLKVLSKLSSNLFLGLKDGLKDDIFAQAQGEKNYFSGPHPAGNPGVQIHHICPVNKGEQVWTINPQHVAIIGRLFLTGCYNAYKTIALVGSGVEAPSYVKIMSSACVGNIVNGKLNKGNYRIISGNVLCGTKVDNEGFIGFYDNEISVIPEGNYYDFFGWCLPGFRKFSTSRTFFSWLNPKKEYDLDTNFHGEERAYVVTGNYEKYLPMDILPMQLIKAILADNIELMEELGIYEVAEEDFALCEFADTSKTEIQSIIRGGLNKMIAETK